MAVPKIWRRIPEMYRLEGNVCVHCNERFFPKRFTCPKCHETKLDPFEFQGSGVITTFTVIRTPMNDPEGEHTDKPARTIPYIMGIVTLAEGPRLTAEIVDVKPEEIAIGSPVEVVFRKIGELGDKGIIQYGYKFKPTKQNT